MRVLVTGGSGYVGSAVVRALVAAGHKVTGLTRSSEAQKKLAALDAHARPGDITQPASLVRAADGHEVLIHAAAISGVHRAEVDRAAIFALIEAARQSGEPRVVIYTSGYWTLGEGGGHEDAPTDHPAIVSAHRPQLEKDVLAAGDEKVVTAVIRPGMIYGGQEGIVGFLCDYIAGAAGQPGVPTFIGDGRNRWTPVHRDDTAALYRLVVEKRARGIFHAVEPEAMPVGDIARRLHGAGAPAPRSWPRAEAETKLGAYAEAFSLDIVGIARRSWDLGWRPEHRFAVEVSTTWKEFKGA
jgi:nucleoside-diphosphate-sugar epimerase